MKSLILSISLSLSLVCVCICTYMGVRIIPTVIRALIVFGVSFAGGILLALVIFVPYFSNKQTRNQQANLPASDSKKV